MGLYGFFSRFARLAMVCSLFFLLSALYASIIRRNQFYVNSFLLCLRQIMLYFFFFMCYALSEGGEQRNGSYKRTFCRIA